MDLTQSKLSRSEWNSIEICVPEDELFILKMINEGSINVNIKSNRHLSIIQFMKLEKTASNETCIYEKYFQKIIEGMVGKYITQTSITPFTVPITSTKDSKALKRGDSIRIENMDITTSRVKIFEYTLLDFCERLLEKLVLLEPTYKIPKKEKSQKKSSEPGGVGTTSNEIVGDKPFVYYLYSLIQFQTISIEHISPFVVQFVKSVVDYAKTKTTISDMVHNAYQIIEQNPYLLKYEDLSLYSHQKELFSIFNRNKNPKLVLYMAPTGTGKTMSPIGISNSHRIIFVCVARHVGLALAKSAISVEKKIAFAFGCETASDIRLHYFAATDYTINKRSGGIGKVDNSIGDKVEIMICDVKSYLVAMQYMLAFNNESNIITYWDEPTITMDYETHELHEQIHKNWAENKISKLVLSCATLPKEHEMTSTIMDFRSKFEDADIFTIQSYDCKKSVSLLGKDGKPALPHLLFSQYDKLQECARHCSENKSLLRYFDLKEIIRFIEYANQNEGVIEGVYKMEYYFDDDIRKVSMNGLKVYYLDLLSKIYPGAWPAMYECLTKSEPTKSNSTSLRSIRSEESVRPIGQTIFRQSSLNASPVPKVSAAQAGILLTTTDAHTLTDGPTIYLAEDIQKVGAFLIHQTKIPDRIFTTMLEKIERNNQYQKKLDVMEKLLEDKLGKDMDKTKKMERENFSSEVKTLKKEVEQLRNQIQVVSMEKAYLPNTQQHQHLWLPNGMEPVKNAFIPDIEEQTVKEIMMLDVDTNKKLLLILGIGTFDVSNPPQYMEVMKRLAMNQKLFIIIASSDYIYGTNYQFCHGFIGRDLQNMTQQKIIQAMGRIGRNKIQQDYTVRFRDDDIMASIFLPPSQNREAEIMCQLFSS
uniref:Helicase/UvrB N-terminal domain-containing protein n=1 Tax=viral metagenome TaxID=1070528 RepID=A0A6C0JWW1_9ZZZZ